MAKNQPQPHLVSSVSTKLKKTIVAENTQICTDDEIQKKKKEMLNVIDQSLELFKRNLESGSVDMSTSLDLERLVKLTLLLSGQPDSITGKPNGQSEQETTVTTQSIGLSMSKIEEILNLDDPEVKAMYDKISKGYNEANDIDE